MNLRQLKYFVGIIDAGNMTRAAETMHVAQTALSMQIRQLEEGLGVALLLRHSRGIEPTAAGKLLYARAQSILKSVDDARREVSANVSNLGEALRLGITPSLMMLIGPDLILGARERAPQVSLSVVEGMSHVLVESLQRGELDYVLCYDVPQAPQWVRAALLQEDLMHVALRGPHSDQPIALVDVLDEVLAMPDPADTVRQAVSRAATDLGLELKVSYELRSIAAMKALALRGIASCVLPMASVADEVRSGHLCARRIVMPPVRRILYLARDARRAEPQNDTALTAVVQEALMPLVSLLGTLGHPLWTRTA